MGRKKLMTISDLYNFFASSNQNFTFSAANDEDRIVVQVPGDMNFQTVGSDTEDLMPVTITVLHTNANLNGSLITEESLKRAIPSFANRPILGFIYQDDNGEYQFRDHAMHVASDDETTREDDTREIIYDEIAVGIIPESNNARFSYDEENERTYVIVDGYLFNDYTKAPEILSREGKCNVSAELAIREMSFDAKRKLLILNDWYLTGVTILGRWPETGEEVNPAMTGANIQIADFSVQNNSLVAMLEEMRQKIDAIHSNFTIDKNTQGKEDKQEVHDEIEMVEMNQEAEEAVVGSEAEAEAEAEVGAEAEAMTEVESEEEVEAKPEDEDEDQESEEAEDEVDEEKEEEVEEIDLGVDFENEAAEAESEESESEEEGEVPEDESSDPEVEKFQKLFEISHEDIRVAIYNLLEPFEIQDNEWYCVTQVFDDYFIYEGWFNANNLYKQGYSKDGDVVSFVGDRVHMNAEYLTDEELATLNEMRNSYFAMSEKLARYEAEPQKMEILNSKEYSVIADTEEFMNLKKVETHFEMEVDAVREAADKILLDAAKGHKINVMNAEKNEKKDTGLKRFPMNGKNGNKKSRYGNLF